MDEVFSLNGQDTSGHSEFGIVDDKNAMITDYTNIGKLNLYYF